MHLLKKICSLLLCLLFLNSCAIASKIRLVCLSPTLTRMLVMIGAGNTVVGVDDPLSEQILGRTVPIVGDFTQINIEKIAALRPSDVLVSGTQSIPGLATFHIPVVVFDPKTLADIATNLRTLGVLSGHTKTASHLAKIYLQGLENLPKRLATQQRVPVFIEIGQDPLYTLTNASLQGQIVTRCGGENIFGNHPGISIPVRAEAVLAARPHIIFTTVPDATRYWSQFPTLGLVQSHRIIVLNANDFSEATPLLLNAARQMCAKIAAKKE